MRKTSRKTKVQVRADGITAITQRLDDILQGAYGSFPIYEDETPWTLGSGVFARFAGAVVQTWPDAFSDKTSDQVGGKSVFSWMRSVGAINEFDDIPKLAERLYDGGWRA